jgi:integrase/recombinase XerD
MKAPFTGLAVSSVTQVVARACARAGVPRFGPHRIRHAAACGLLSAGVSMEEIGQLLRHAQQRTTAIYATLGNCIRRESLRWSPDERGYVIAACRWRSMPPDLAGCTTIPYGA